MQALIRRDNAGAAENFSYVEFDVHVSVYGTGAICPSNLVISAMLDSVYVTLFADYWPWLSQLMY